MTSEWEQEVVWAEDLPPRDYLMRMYFPVCFPVSLKIFQEYELEKIFQRELGAYFAKPTQVVHRLVNHIERKRVNLGKPVEPVQVGKLLAFGILAEAMRYVFDWYCRYQAPENFLNALQQTIDLMGTELFTRCLRGFERFFPSLPTEEYGILKALKEGLLSEEELQQVLVRELFLLRLFHEDPALKPLLWLCDDMDLSHETPYRIVMQVFEDQINLESPVQPLGLPLGKSLRSPIESFPDSLEGQLDYIRTHWQSILPPWLLRRLILARDIMREETWARGFGPGPVEILRFGREAQEYGYPEPERFTVDADWMSSLVLIAKVIYVWLDQLSRQYNRPIQRLDEIPDEELDKLARWGFSGLWLIGIWERSVASKTIKQLTGNPEAAASAYSLYDYVVAEDLGGESALLRLRERAAKRGIRLATDLVPNHVGIYSKWVIEHPDWFIQTKEPPFPNYRFTGPDLCPEERVTIRIEDGYWDRRDAAVVFQRIDNWTGDVRYIYHGNDGTNMPWNDTAQLNYLLPEVREAVIQTILRVARDFPIIRFDAAMTLTKRHYQRLWFPLPGEGGAIPSRSLFSMTRAEFDAAMPEEFWRQVVDRVTAEAPDTLLLAEAFWLMEGYFVRTLGMHRVYNSAFMNMLKMEDNLKYRMTVKNVLEFSPEVLKRFVNFMNNPDELTAVEQFGKGDKYFGVAVMMVTMPGLPMFGHGQIEGFREKYGMEYRRAYWNETVDEELVRRHEREIFPLMRKRYLFSGVDHFAFYDFIHADQYVDENVFAYSNYFRGERTLVIYNNSYNTTHGRIYASTAINVGSADNPRFIHKSLAEALFLRADPNVFYIFRDHRDNRQYIREGADLAKHGLYCVLQGYQYHVFLDFQEIVDTTGLWRKVAMKLNGAGTWNLEKVYREVSLESTLKPLREIFDASFLRSLIPMKGRITKRHKEARQTLILAVERYLDAVEQLLVEGSDRTQLRSHLEKSLSCIQTLSNRIKRLRLPKEILACCQEYTARPSHLVCLVVWSILCELEALLAVGTVDGSAKWLHDWLIDDAIREMFRKLGESEKSATRYTDLVGILVKHTPELLASSSKEAVVFFESLLDDHAVRSYLHVNEFGGEWWLGKEQLEELLHWLMCASTVAILQDEDLGTRERSILIRTHWDCVETIRNAAAKAGYRIRVMLELLR